MCGEARDGGEGDGEGVASYIQAEEESWCEERGRRAAATAPVSIIQSSPVHRSLPIAEIESTVLKQRGVCAMSKIAEIQRACLLDLYR